MASVISLSAECPIKRNISLLTNSDPQIRRQAVETLGRCMNKIAVQPIIKLYKSEQDINVRQAIILSLSLLGGDDVLSILLDVLENDSDLETRRNAAGGLRFFGGKIKGSDLVDLIIKENDTAIRNVLVGTVIYLRNETLIPKLLDLFYSNEDIELKGCLLEIIGTFDTEKSKDLLINSIANDVPEELRLIATQAMGKLDDVKLIPHIYEVYKNDNSKKIVECAEKILNEYTLLLGYPSIDQMVIDFITDKK
ncbi:MAG: HEAT repeat domain-containing protein [Asgard group archaeon]|nr:HEAT repeat domain-containing protein [Asgard group archaeon]